MKKLKNIAKLIIALIIIIPIFFISIWAILGFILLILIFAIIARLSGANVKINFNINK